MDLIWQSPRPFFEEAVRAMQIVLGIGVLGLSYLLGSIPFGLLIVKLKTGKDIRTVESGRTGGTNAMRAAGFFAGLMTAILDLLKSAVCVWIVRALLPGAVWLEVFAPVIAILGHNYSIFLVSRNEKGQLRLRGGAGGAPTAGGAFGLWPPSLLFIVPIAAVILFGIGYASVATMSAALIAAIIFAIRAAAGSSPWPYVIYGLAAELVLMWALRPNIRRLLNGTERVVGWRAKRMKNKE
jgi:glycerol-3-phosphate acyltransferase PlsY